MFAIFGGAFAGNIIEIVFQRMLKAKDVARETLTY